MRETAAKFQISHLLATPALLIGVELGYAPIAAQAISIWRNEYGLTHWSTTIYLLAHRLHIRSVVPFRKRRRWRRPWNRKRTTISQLRAMFGCAVSSCSSL